MTRVGIAVMTPMMACNTICVWVIARYVSLASCDDCDSGVDFGCGFIVEWETVFLFRHRGNTDLLEILVIIDEVYLVVWCFVWCCSNFMITKSISCIIQHLHQPLPGSYVESHWLGFYKSSGFVPYSFMSKPGQFILGRDSHIYVDACM